MAVTAPKPTPVAPRSAPSPTGTGRAVRPSSPLRAALPDGVGQALRRTATEVAAEAAPRVATQVAEKVVVRGIFAWLGTRLAALAANPVVGAAAAVSDLCPGDTPIRDDEPVREPPPPLVIDQPPFGKTVEQWLYEMAEATQIAAEIYNLQNQIQQLHRQGQGHLAWPLQQKLSTFLAQAHTIQKGYGLPISGGLQMVASADVGATTPAGEGTTSSDPTRKYLDDIEREARDCPHLTDAQRDGLYALIAEVRSGNRPVVDVAREVYELRRAISTQSAKPNGLLKSALSHVDAALNWLYPDGPRFGNRVPSFDELQQMANFGIDDVIFTATPSERDDLNALHAQGKSVWLISLADAIPSNHSSIGMDGTTYAIHDYFHLLQFFSVPEPVRDYAATLYTIIAPILTAHSIEDGFHLYLDRLVELGTEFDQMGAVVQFPRFTVERLIAQRHPVLAALYNALYSYNWVGPFADRMRQATEAELQTLPAQTIAIRRAPETDWLAVANATEQQDVAVRLQEIEAAMPAFYKRVIQLCDSVSDFSMTPSWTATLLAENEALLDAIHILVQKDPTPIHYSFKHNLSGRINFRLVLQLMERQPDQPRVGIELLKELSEERLVLASESQYDFPLSRLISACASGARVEIHADGLKLKIANRSHQDKFQWVLWNILRNAGQHPRDGQDKVDVNVTLNGNRLVIQDDGTGMSFATLAALRAGIRIHDGLPVDSGDHGIGMQDVRRKCEEMGIGLEIESTEGVGSTFTLILPEGFLKPVTP